MTGVFSKMSKHVTPFWERVEEMMKDDPLLKVIRSQTKEQVTQRLEKLGIIKDGKVCESYKKKFSGFTRAPKSS